MVSAGQHDVDGFADRCCECLSKRLNSAQVGRSLLKLPIPKAADTWQQPFLQDEGNGRRSIDRVIVECSCC